MAPLEESVEACEDRNPQTSKHRPSSLSPFKNKEYRNKNRNHDSNKNDATHHKTRTSNRFTMSTSQRFEVPPQSSAKQKAVYHAVWQHSSPRKLKNNKPKSPKISERENSMQRSTMKQCSAIQKIPNKNYSRPIPEDRFQCSRGKPRFDSRIQNRRLSNCVYNYHDHPRVRFVDSSDDDVEATDSVSVCGQRTVISPPSPKVILCPVRSLFDMDSGQGDCCLNRISSDSSCTSVCTAFHTVVEDWCNRSSTSLTSLEYYSNNDRKCNEIHRRGYKEDQKPRHQSMNSSKGSPKCVKFDRISSYEEGDNIKVTTTKSTCFCQCHKSQQSPKPRRSPFSKDPSTTSDKEAVTKQILEQMVNKEALKVFAKRVDRSKQDVRLLSNESFRKGPGDIEKKICEWKRLLGHRDSRKDDRHWVTKEGYLMRSSVSM